MVKTIRWGIIGCGKIAAKFVSDLKLVDEAEVYAVAARSLDAAAAFATKHQASKAYGSYSELVQDEAVDVIYIATPHNFHYEHAMLCMAHGKAVLCEKPFAINTLQAKEMIDFARQKKIFLMEALWTKFLPHYQQLMHLIQEGKLGAIKSVLINFGFKPQPPVSPRLFDPQLGGGTMLDIGIYNVFMALSVLGKPQQIQAVMTPHAVTGVDEQCAVLFTYANGAIAQLYASFVTTLPTEAEIAGTMGSVRLTSRFYEPSSTIQYYPFSVRETTAIEVPKEAGFGYQYEARHVNECLQQGLIESPVWQHADTLLLMETLDIIRKIAGIRYPEDDY
ncbi:Gfo/Idh/MocA family oxidoreductase [Hydrotalea sp.]|uniref:Gfo/Idh/MocA family protein n=1 Tax=Hydrotalea sp. TaxID=2881279 RepID=UPI00263032AD|nr:Gfo/Idh/MocA family oxidoreductase [Hydrotalea sp.]